jgi:uncharacterized protein
VTPETVDIPLFPLNAVLFPTTRLPLRIFEERYKRLYEDSLKGGARFGIALIKEGLEAGGPLATPFDVGTLAEIESVDHHGDSIFLLCRGTRRFRIRELKTDREYLVGRVELLPEPGKPTKTETEAAAELQRRFDDYLERFRAFAKAMGGELRAPEPRPDLGVHERVFGIALTLPLDLAQKQELLETSDLGEFILRLSQLLEGEAAFLRPDAEDPSIA